jgi:integrase
MRVEDFDPLSNTVALTHTKGGRDRRVPLTDEGARFFLALTISRPATDVIFKRADGNSWGVQDQKRQMAAACAAGQIAPAIGFHVLRHTYGSLLAQAGVSMAVIAAALGHADSRMTERHYAHLSPSHVAAQIRQHLPDFRF